VGGEGADISACTREPYPVGRGGRKKLPLWRNEMRATLSRGEKNTKEQTEVNLSLWSNKKEAEKHISEKLRGFLGMGGETSSFSN